MSEHIMMFLTILAYEKGILYFWALNVNQSPSYLLKFQAN